LFAAAGLHPEIIMVAGKDVSAAAKQAAAGDQATIVAGGGDGTISTVAGNLGPRKKYWACCRSTRSIILPGTLHIPLDLNGAVEFDYVGIVIAVKPIARYSVVRARRDRKISELLSPTITG
jgi:hypothetical protein